MAFTNTVDVVGDAALTRSIVDRSITELNDNISTSIRQQAFRACTALASVNFPSVTSVALGAFWQCTALAKAEFSASVAFANNAFYGCTALTALILRNTEQICTITGTPFAASAIASGTGYIYVPAALVDQYKASWTGNAAQIRAIEDYPGIADPYSWTGVAANIADGSYKSVYRVGDLVPLDLGSEGLINMQIAAFDADDKADGSGKAAISWVSKELLKTSHRMNPALVTLDDGTYQEGTGAIGGWEKSEMRTYLNNTVLSMIPENVSSMIKTVAKYSDSFDISGTEINSAVTEDSVWIPSCHEMSKRTDFEKVGVTYTELFNSNSSLCKTDESKNIKNYWTRTAGNKPTFWGINFEGSLYAWACSSNYGICLGFCT